MASSLWRGPRSAWARWNAVCAVSCNRLILGRGATLFDARSGAMPASSRPSLTSPLRHDFREPDVVAPILDRFQEQRLSDVRRIDEGIAAEAVEKRLRLLALDYLREPLVHLVYDRLRRAGWQHGRPPAGQIHGHARLGHGRHVRIRL